MYEGFPEGSDPANQQLRWIFFPPSRGLNLNFTDMDMNLLVAHPKKYYRVDYATELFEDHHRNWKRRAGKL